MTDILLVEMPYNPDLRPSVGLSILKSSLIKKKLQGRVYYGSIEFAQEIGLDVYRLISSANADALLGEWTFAASAFPDFKPSHEEAFLHNGVKQLNRTLLKTQEIFHGDVLYEKLLREVRSKATDFVRKLAERIVAEGVKIVGCTSVCQQHCASLALLRQIKQLDETIVTAMGGPNCEGSMGKTTHHEFPWVDYVFLGEADFSFSELCESILVEGKTFEPCKDNEFRTAILTPTHRQKVGVQETYHAIYDLDETPIPEYSDYFIALGNSGFDRYVQPGIPAETSRGCWWGAKQQCTFCARSKDKIAFRAKSPGRVIDEVQLQAERYQNKRIVMVDSIMNMDYLRTVFPSLSQKEETYHIFYEARANLTRAHFEQLVSAGVQFLQCGIESLHDTMLKLLNKGSSATLNIRMLRLAQEYGLTVFWNALIGIPGESEEFYYEMAEWLPRIFHLQPPLFANPILFERYSPYVEQPGKWDLNLCPSPVYRQIYPCSEEALSNLAWFFVNSEQSSCSSSQQHSKQVRIERNSMKNHPGIRAFFKRMTEWKALFYSDTPPIFRIKDQADFLHYQDTRPIALEPEGIIEGLAYRIYMLCDSPCSLKALPQRLQKTCNIQASEQQISDTVEELVSKAFLLKLDDKLISLGVQESVRTLPSLKDCPASCLISDADIFKTHAPYSLAKQFTLHGDSSAELNV